MADNFDWRTEDEVVWDDRPTTRETAVSRHPPWFILVPIGFVLLVAGFVVYRRVQERMELTAAAVETDILTTHRLVQQAGRQKDVDLFHSLLSGRNLTWSEAQEELVAQGLLWERAAFSLRQLPPEGTADDLAALDLVVDPTLDRAELRFNHAYAFTAAAGVTETTRLQQTAVYRRGRQRWLYSPPDDEFWGEWVSYDGRHLAGAFPERDQEWGQRLFRDLDDLLVTMCRDLEDIDCPFDLRIHLRLERTPDSLTTAADPAAILANGYRLTLPTPTLVGLPLDEAGYRALYRGYAVQLLTAVIAQLVDYECCRSGQLFLALLDRQFDQLGLQPWPLNRSQYAALFRESGGTAYNANLLWAGTWRGLASPDDPQRPRLHALVDYLLATTPASAAEMQRTLSRSSSFWGWVDQFVTGALPDDLIADWLAYIYRQSLPAQPPPPPVPLPDQEITLICDNRETGNGNSIVWFNPAAASWREENLPTNSSSFLYPLAVTADAILLGESTFAVDRPRTRIIRWRAGENEVLYETEGDDTGTVTWFNRAGTDDGRYLLAIVSIPDDFDSAAPHLLDLDRCRTRVCDAGDLLPLPGRPHWSPDGTRALFTKPLRGQTNPEDIFQTRLYLGDARGETVQAAGTGGHPLWLDDETYSFVRLGADGEPELVAANVDDGETRLLARLSDLLNAIPAAERPSQLSFVAQIARPAHDGELLVLAAAESRQPPYHFFSLMIDQGLAPAEAAQWLYRSDEAAAVYYSPDGRWLALRPYLIMESGRISASDSPWRLFDQDTGDTMDIDLPLGDTSAFLGTEAIWSPGGQWLLQTNELYLALYAPTYDDTRLFFRDLEGCYLARWAES